MRKNLFSTIRFMERIPLTGTSPVKPLNELRCMERRPVLSPPRVWIAFQLSALVYCAPSVRAQEKINYTEHILPVIEANCSKCHNSDKKKADLDLTSYPGALKGSGSGVVLLSGNPEGSKLWKAVTHSEEPFMPPNRPKLADKELDLIKKWIAGGLLENAGAKAIAVAKPSVDLTLQADALGK